MKKYFYIAVSLLLFSSASVMAQETPSLHTQRYVADEVLVKFKPANINLQKSSGMKSMKSFAINQELSTESTLPAENISVMKITDGQSVDQVIQDLQNDPSVDYVQPNFVYSIQMADPNDTYFGNQRWLKNIGQNWWTSGADIERNKAMDIWSGNSNQNTIWTTVAVIDVGIRYNHPDFVWQLWDGTNCLSYQWTALGNCSYGYDTLDGDKNPQPSGTDSHGTHIAGIIWAKVNNGIGVAGINPGAKIMSIRAGTEDVGLSTSDIIEAISFAKYNGAKIINASRWSNEYSCQDARSWDQGLYNAIKNFPWLFIVAAWNGTGGIGQQHLNNRYATPADYNTNTSCWSGLDNVVSVAATNNTDHLASFSDYWSTVNIAAPWVNIASTVLSNGYAYMDGTSMATPFVAAVASLARSMRPELDYLSIKNAILHNADYITGLNVAWSRRLNAYNTLYDLVPPATGAITFLSWNITNNSWTSVRLVASKTWTYIVSGAGMSGTLTWNISLTWLDVVIQLTPGDGVKNIGVTFFDSLAKPSQVYTASIILDTTAPSIPVLSSPIWWTSVSWTIYLLRNSSIDTWWMSGYYYEVSNDSGMNTLLATWTLFTTWISVNLTSWDTYYRRVKAFDMMWYTSSFSQTGSFVLLRDSWPDAFSFTSLSSVELSTEQTSNQIVISGINTGTEITISSWWTYQVNNTWDFVATTWIAYNWDSINIKLTSSSSNSSSTTVTLSIGGTVWTFTVTTKAAPWGGGGWGGGGWGGWTPPTPSCTITNLICSWSVYIKKTSVNCEWGIVWQSCTLVATWSTGNIMPPVIHIFTPSLQGSISGSPFSPELNSAYQYAYTIWITTIPSIEQANITWTLLRKHLAKMMSNFAIHVLDKMPNTWLVCNFDDMWEETSEMTFYAKLACQLGLMGRNSDGTQSDTFFPNEEVTRAQFGTVLSRALRWDKYNTSGADYFTEHLNALNQLGIMKNISDPLLLEIRWFVMLMMMRTDELIK